MRPRGSSNRTLISKPSATSLPVLAAALRRNRQTRRSSVHARIRRAPTYPAAIDIHHSLAGTHRSRGGNHANQGSTLRNSPGVPRRGIIPHSPGDSRSRQDSMEVRSGRIFRARAGRSTMRGITRAAGISRCRPGKSAPRQVGLHRFRTVTTPVAAISRFRLPKTDITRAVAIRRLRRQR